MIPFSFLRGIYRAYMAILKWVVMMVPAPRPTLYQGVDSSLELCEAIEQMGVKRLLVVTDAMLVKIGLLNPVLERLSELGVEHAVFDGVEPDPTIAQIEAGLEAVKSSDAEAILAIGGGSSIDAAKMIAARVTHPNKPVRKMDGLFKLRAAMMPLFVIPTTAGTGSEVTLAAVVSDPDNKRKFAAMDPKLVPDMAALDGKLMTGLPPHITAATGMDALTHAVEAYISRNALPDTDRYGLAATRLIMENLPKVMEDGSDIEARQNMAVASHFAALAFTRAGVGYVHAISHNFGAYYHVPHGLANAIVLPHVLAFSKPECTERLARLAEVSGLDGANDDAKAEAFIEHIRELNRRFDIPAGLDKIRDEDIPGIAKAALKEAHWTYAVPRYMNRGECERFIAGIKA